MKQSLFQGMDKDEVKEFKEEFIKSTLFRKGLVKVLERKIEAVQAKMETPDYNNPNWINEQTDHIGFIKSHKQLISLLKENNV